MKQNNTARRLEPVDDTIEQMREDVRAGLGTRAKRLSSKYFYDARGSELFEQICALPEYYLTRTELSILREHGADMARVIGPNAMVVEYGSGSGTKTGLLLEALDDPAAFVPIEISMSALNGSLAKLARRFPEVEMLPLCGDFTAPLRLPRLTHGQADRTLIFFPGSTLGNFEYSDAIRLLSLMRKQMGEQGMALIGIDLKKDEKVLEAAYNDRAGVTAAFTLNMLEHLNRAIGTDFDLEQFAHRSRYNPLHGRIETHIVSRRDQTVSMMGEETKFTFSADERMLVEYSCKYSPQEFERMASKAGLSVTSAWTDKDELFSLQLLRWQSA